jgi:hypothetical protein
MSRELVSAYIKRALEGSRPVQMTFKDAVQTDVMSTASFFYDPPGSPMRSTQQLNVDWSRFENHTFFGSAEAKVNVAFDQVINGYPFDGTRREVEEFLGRLTGFERWVFDRFPRRVGALHFSGTLVGETSGGTSVTVQDAQGAAFPDVARRRSGEAVLDPTTGSLSIELQLHVPAQANDVQVVCHKVSGSSKGFALYLSQSASPTTVDACFAVFSGSASVSAHVPLRKGRFEHLCAVLDRSSGVPAVRMYRDSTLMQQSVGAYELGSIDTAGASMVVGSGSSFVVRGTTVVPRQTLSGTMDELRVFHSARTAAQQSQYAARSLFATHDLRLYYRFNEPPPPLTSAADDPIDAVVLDSSGNSLHAYVSGFTGSLRVDMSGSAASPMLLERADFAPVLFPAHSGVLALNAELLVSASTYDSANPNIITRLVPPHYLLEGRLNDGLSTDEGTINGPYTGTDVPGTGRLGGTQYMLSFLYIWARFFDEMKLYVDAFGSLHHVDHALTDTVPDGFLEGLVRQHGFDLPPLFSDATVQQYLDADNVDPAVSSDASSLQRVRSQVLRRILASMPDIVRSKGTLHSVKSFFRAVGIDPDSTVRIREHGGPTSRQLTYARERKRTQGTMVPFGAATVLVSAPLSGSRREPGHPPISGTMVRSAAFPPHGVSDSRDDGLLTSGSWTVELAVKYTPTQARTLTSLTQGIVRLVTDGHGVASGGGVLASLLAMSGTAEQSLSLFLRPGMHSSSSPALTMTLPATPVFDGTRWHLSFGCVRNDEIGSVVSSSYFLRAARSEEGRIIDARVTSSFFNEQSGAEGNAFRHLTQSPGVNETGPFLQMGAVALGTGPSECFLNNTSVVSAAATTTNFDGQAADLRFWSRALSEQEWHEHVRNPRSTGASDPLVGYNFGTTRSGSFGRLRLETLTNKCTVPDGTGAVTFYDVSLNGRHVSGSGFEPSVVPLVSEVFDHSLLSPYFDEAVTDEKVRIRSLQEPDPGFPLAAQAPMYELPRDEEPTDDTRLAIELSLVDALNRDMMSMFADLNPFATALGVPELALADDYPDLSRLRDLYFNRLGSKLDFKAFFEFFRWFDGSIGTFVAQLVPRKTLFRGMNFVVEQHVLERAKIAYRHADLYLSQAARGDPFAASVVPELDGPVGKH